MKGLAFGGYIQALWQAASSRQKSVKHDVISRILSPTRYVWPLSCSKSARVFGDVCKKDLLYCIVLYCTVLYCSFCATCWGLLPPTCSTCPFFRMWQLTKPQNLVVQSDGAMGKATKLSMSELEGGFFCAMPLFLRERMPQGILCLWTARYCKD